jgi:hypothetical protein
VSPTTGSTATPLTAGPVEAMLGGMDECGKFEAAIDRTIPAGDPEAGRD